MSTSYTKEHLEGALTWVERNVHDGIRIVAGALSATYPDDEPATAEAAAPSTVQDIAASAAEDVSRMLEGRDVLVLVVDGETMRVGACLDENSKQRTKEILASALGLLSK